MDMDMPGMTTKMPMHDMGNMGGMKMDHAMWMWFHTKCDDTVLFSFWNIKSPGQMVYSCIIVILMAMLLEFVRYFRWRLEVHTKKNSRLQNTKYATFSFGDVEKGGVRERTYTTRLFSQEHLIQTLIFGVQLVLSYMVMLIFMTFSVWLGLAVCFGEALGYYLFGSRKIARGSL